MASTSKKFRSLKKANEKVVELKEALRLEKMHREHGENRIAYLEENLEQIAELLLGPNWRSEICIEDVVKYVTGLMNEVEYSKKLYRERDNQMQYMAGERDRLFGLVREILVGPSEQRITGGGDIPMQGLPD